MILGVTGNIGSGKSFVAKELSQLVEGEYCNADALCRGLMAPGAPGLDAVVKTWGDRFLLENGELDRKTLRETIFADAEIRKMLDSLMHPLAYDLMYSYIRRCRENHIHLVAEVPLLFESGWQELFDLIITVSVAEDVTIARVVARDGVSVEQVRQTLAAQMSLEKKIALSHYVIHNEGTVEQTRNQLKILTETIKEKYCAI